VPAAVADEPRVVTDDVAALIRRAIGPDEADSVALIAERANRSTRTIYRILGGEWPTIALELADAVCLAAGGHLTDCRVVEPGGTVE